VRLRVKEKLTAPSRTVRMQEADRREVLQQRHPGVGRKPASEPGGPVVTAGLRGARHARAVHRGRLVRAGRQRTGPRHGHGGGRVAERARGLVQGVLQGRRLLRGRHPGRRARALPLRRRRAPLDYLDDLVAVQRGVTVVCSAGNDGPKPRTVTNVAPVRAPRTGTSRPTSTS
jgi:hypothetical protein